MEEMYRRLVEDLRQQHTREVAELLKEKEELLEEETAATMAGKQRSIRPSIHPIIGGSIRPSIQPSIGGSV
jgi:transcription initiation factor IIE alpha subunit